MNNTDDSIYWFLKNITFKKYSFIYLVDIMLQTAHQLHENLETVRGISWHNSADHFHFCFGLVMTLN